MTHGFGKMAAKLLTLIGNQKNQAKAVIITTVQYRGLMVNGGINIVSGTMLNHMYANGHSQVLGFVLIVVFRIRHLKVLCRYNIFTSLYT